HLAGAQALAQHLELALVQRDRTPAVRMRDGDRGEQLHVRFEEIGVLEQIVRDVVGVAGVLRHSQSVSNSTAQSISPSKTVRAGPVMVSLVPSQSMRSTPPRV